jgi:hypothetical protein
VHSRGMRRDTRGGKKERKSWIKLLSCMDKDAKNSLVFSPGYQQMYDQFDILGIWRLMNKL